MGALVTNEVNTPEGKSRAKTLYDCWRISDDYGTSFVVMSAVALKAVCSEGR